MSINTPHKVTLTEGEIGYILCNLEKEYGHLLDVHTVLEEANKWVLLETED